MVTSMSMFHVTARSDMESVSELKVAESVSNHCPSHHQPLNDMGSEAVNARDRTVYMRQRSRDLLQAQCGSDE